MTRHLLFGCWDASWAAEIPRTPKITVGIVGVAAAAAEQSAATSKAPTQRRATKRRTSCELQALAQLKLGQDIEGRSSNLQQLQLTMGQKPGSEALRSRRVGRIGFCVNAFFNRSSHRPTANRATNRSIHY